MPINCLVKCLINSDSEQSCSKNQFMVNSWIIHEHSCFKKTVLSSFVLVFHPFIFGSPAAQNDGLSLFNTHSVLAANTLKTKDLRKRHFWFPIFESGETTKTQNVRCKIRPIIRPLSRRPYTPHAARNRPYMLRRETLHYVRFYVGFADPILHT